MSNMELEMKILNINEKELSNLVENALVPLSNIYMYMT